jgi:hypothetical protein
LTNILAVCAEGSKLSIIFLNESETKYLSIKNEQNYHDLRSIVLDTVNTQLKKWIVCHMLDYLYSKSVKGVKKSMQSKKLHHRCLKIFNAQHIAIHNLIWSNNLWYKLSSHWPKSQFVQRHKTNIIFITLCVVSKRTHF